MISTWLIPMIDDLPTSTSVLETSSQQAVYKEVVGPLWL
jgi:hypothetical protein